jgi:uncharacterized protein (DUF58 family)
VLSKKSSALAILALLAVLFGILTDKPSLALVALPLFGYLVVSILYSPESNVDLSINRFIEKETIYEDESVKVDIEVTNNGPKIDFLDLIDNVPSDLIISEGTNHIIISLAARERFRFSYSVKPKVYGFYEWGPFFVSFGDLQSTIVGAKKYSIITNLRVLPKIGYIAKINIRPKRTKNWPGEILSKKPGSGMEFYSLRDYSWGDPVRRINWKASSRSDERLFTNQFMSELGGDTIIALDARTVSEVGTSSDSTITYSVQAAAAVAYRLLRDRNRVGMIVLGSILEKILPGFGKRQFDRILVALSETKTDEIWEIGTLGPFLSTFFSTMVQIVVISPLNDDKAFGSIVDVAQRGYRVLVISPSPIEIEKKRAIATKKYDESYKLGERLLRVQRENRLNELRQVAVVADWNTELPLSDALQEATYQWNRQRMVA